MILSLSEGRFFALKWLVRRNAVQICAGKNELCGNMYFYFSDNSCVSLSDSKIVIMPYKGDHIVITKAA